MDLHAVVFVSLLTWASVLSERKNGHVFRGNFWQTLAPGELLNELDLLTTNELQNRKYFKPLTVTENESTTVAPLKRRKTTGKPARKNKKTKSTPIRRLTEDGSAASTSASVEQEDYDHAYEQFVNRYFNEAADRYLSDHENDGGFNDGSTSQEANNLSGSIEADIVAPFDAQPLHTSPKAKKSKRTNKNCRKVRKHGEICLICRNPRNDEHSETCSYEHSSEPETYAYEKQRSFRKNRNSDDGNDDDNVGAEDDSDEYVAETKLLAQTVPPWAPLNETRSNEFSENSSCIKRSAGEKVCYYCRNSLGELQVNCFASKPLEFELRPGKKPIDENSYKTRRIFKRTLSYVFEKGHDSNGTLDLPNEFTQNSTEHLS